MLIGPLKLDCHCTRISGCQDNYWHMQAPPFQPPLAPRPRERPELTQPHSSANVPMCWRVAFLPLPAALAARAEGVGVEGRQLDNPVALGALWWVAGLSQGCGKPLCLPHAPGPMVWVGEGWAAVQGQGLAVS